MDYTVTWSPAALGDVEAIAEYIGRDSGAYAMAIVGKIVDASRKLRDFPRAGRIVPELADVSIRERFVYSYYRIADHTVLIVAVVHGKRLLEPLVDRISDTL